MKSTITIKDVAKKAGVSISTVSRVINDSKPVTDEVKRKVELALKNLEIKEMIIAGGVSANQYLRKEIQEIANQYNVHLSIPDIKYCTDNAAMIGAAAYYAYLKGDRADFSLNPEPGLDL